MTIAEVKAQIASTSVRTVVESALQKAKDSSEFHALLSLVEDRALARADEIDAKIKSGESVGELAGVPFIAKDNMLVFGAPTTAASKILENFDAPFQAEAIERLEAAGAICIGKANLDAFAHGGSTENSAFGPTLNPHDRSRVPGGSSGGSAAAVALDIVSFALGTDTGGSIRQPASFCGVVGMKPTYGTVSRYGVVAMASSTDVIGPLTHTIDDAHTVMRCIAGRDDKDSTTLPNFYADTGEAASSYKIGVVDEWMGEGVDGHVKMAIEKKIAELEAAGHDVERVKLPTLAHALAVYYVIVPAEIASNLARYDGVRYGLRSKKAVDVASMYADSREEGFMPENKRRIMIGNYVLSSGYYDAYFEKAAKVRTLMVNELNDAFTSYDFLVGPVAPTTAFELGENTSDPLSMYLSDQMTVSASLTGLPAVSVPLNTGDAMPVGMQIIGAAKSDSRLLSFAKEAEGARS